MFNKKSILMLIIFTISMFLIGCGGSNDAVTQADDTEKEVEKAKTEEVYKVTATHVGTEESDGQLAFLEFKEYVEKESDGLLEIEIFPNGELYPSEREGIEATQAGNIELFYPATSPLAGFVKEFSVLDLPFLFENEEEGNTALDGELGEMLFDGLNDAGLKGLGWGTEGMTHFTNSKHPINTLDDLKRLKFRVMENNIYLDTFAAMDLNAQPFAFGELYSAFQQNIFDGQVTTIYLNKTFNFYEVQDYMTISNFTFMPTILFANSDFHNSLPEDLQKVMVEGGQVFTDFIRGKSVELEQEALEYLDENIEVGELPEETRNELIDMTESVYEKYEKELGTEIIELAKNSAKK